MKKKSLSELIQELKNHENIVHWHEEEPREAKTMPMPEQVDPNIRAALEKRGIERLFTHQYSAFQTVQNGESIVAVTPTASGKTLCVIFRFFSLSRKMPQAAHFIYFRQRRSRRIKKAS